jgi:Tol biopolymer transport system component
MILSKSKLLTIPIYFLIGLLLFGCDNSSKSTVEIISHTSTPTQSATRSPTNTKESTPTAIVISRTPINLDYEYSNSSLVLSFYYYDESGMPIENSQIYIMNLNGEIEKQLTNADESHIYHNDTVWSPDCQMIAFTKDTGFFDNEYHEMINIIDKEGNFITEILTPYQINSSPSWSPDGRHIAFDAWLGENSQMFKYDLDTQSITQITSDGSNQSPDWSPTNEYIVFQSRRVEDYGPSIYIMNPDGSSQKEIVPSFWGNDPSDFDHPGMDLPSNPKWSPDGKYIALQVREDYLDNQVVKIYISDLDGSNLHRLIDGDPHNFDLNDPDFYFINEHYPLWSPDGMYIFFIRMSSYSGYTQLCYADVKTGEWSCLTNQYENIVVLGVDWCHANQDTEVK